MEILRGVVERVTFHSPDTGWSVLRVTPQGQAGKVVTVTVHQSKVFAGATVDFEGAWTEHPKYGEQFKAEKVTERKPASASALEKYLGSGLIYGVGPVTAKRIVKHFGDKTLDVFEDNIERLMEVPGIAKTKLDQISGAWNEHRSIRDVMMFLQEYGVSTLFAVKIFKQYEHEAISIVKKNPYRLSYDIYGIGFFSADRIALAMGFAKDSPLRVGAAIKHVLNSSREEGHCYLTRDQILEGVKELIAVDDPDLVLEQLKEQEINDEIRYRDVKEDEAKDPTWCYYAKSLYYDEANTATVIKSLVKPLAIDKKRVENWLERYCATQPFPLSDEQRRSVAGIVANQFSVLTGGPGCGKTTTTKTIVKLAVAMGLQVTLAAPTGRASQRMSEVIGQEARTIHRLLVWDPSNGRFKKNAEDTLDTDFLIVDECSMLDISLSASLLDAVPPKARVLFIGDADQLPSVGAGNVLKDIIASGAVPCFHLTQIFRQGKESEIITYAHEINKGKTPRPESPIHVPNVWSQNVDCLFVDSEEATQEQAGFIRKIRGVMKNVIQDTGNSFVQEEPGVYKSVIQDEAGDYYTEEISEEEISEIRHRGAKAYIFNVPERFVKADVGELLQSETDAEALRQVIGKVHPWSSLGYGFTATEMIHRLYAKTIPERKGPLEIQILSPMTRGSLGTRNLNTMIQERCNPASDGKPTLNVGDRKFRPGDRVIQRRNNYDLEVFNGDIGKVERVDTEEMRMEVRFTGGESRLVEYKKESLIELDLAYGITIHKSQGSEFDVVIIPVATQHFKMLYRNLIYTGLTRARKLAIFVGSRKALSMAVRNIDTSQRQTYLKVLLGGLS
ncbi:hypothetical protein FUAX_38830 (plasmid) [Fulvitalea axinellae]|uniref:AAA+ ATPase domain-containing protein n=1 Tax=Fulvitalea axinellae TaxID=1182444 RepID=A0AAU9CH02_9BACT|nr:hypothetical protein FUAX_38830 [Fulvitalea axinellae]